MFNDISYHSFHIPVMGLGFTLDTPVKVARYGISSAVSIMDDLLIEEMRQVLCNKLGKQFIPIGKEVADGRAKRITAYLNLLDEEVKKQTDILKKEPFGKNGEIDMYFQLLPGGHPLRHQYNQMLEEEGSTRTQMQYQLRKALIPGKIDVNIMTKLDKLNYDKKDKLLAREYSDALSALRGFAQSNLNASVVFSAGLNPALYSYLEQFDDFFPNATGDIRKGVILKVSDYRSAMIQGKFLAKKGIWISEFRIESGLNCGGHAFATEGVLLGPILEEFKTNRKLLNEMLLDTCNQALLIKEKPLIRPGSSFRITVQGGIGTAGEQKFLLDYYGLEGTGWGSPFLLVPEATNVDDETLQKLVHAKKSDYYLSQSSPLGVPFNNLRTSSSEVQRKERMAKNRPGSPCYKKFLSFNTEFTEMPICTASRQYQDLKLKQLKAEFGDSEAYTDQAERILEKECLCEGLGAPALLSNGVIPPRKLKAVAICPGPNLAYYSGTYSLKEMVGHIYGESRISIDANRPHMFVKELQLYVDYLKTEMGKWVTEQPKKFESYLERFQSNLISGIQYYQELVVKATPDTREIIDTMRKQFSAIEKELTVMGSSRSLLPA